MTVDRKPSRTFLRLEGQRSVDWFDALIGYFASAQVGGHLFWMLPKSIRDGPYYTWPVVSKVCDVLVPMFWYVGLRRRFPIGSLKWSELRPWVLYWLIAIVVMSCAIGSALLLGLGSQLRESTDVSFQALIFFPIGPTGEEFLWRGLIQSGLNQTLPFRLHMRKANVGVGTLLTAVLFGYAHMGNLASQPLQITCLQAVSAIIGGLVLGIGYERTRNLWGAVICHIIADATAVALTVFLVR